ncbi:MULTISPECIES: hypothetical protein [unclassified Mesorhizobium]|uniref:DUF6894 family protein n=1 Tax=unclassified Mesorhizobium TaxID=325217 RepID=UPI000FCA9196|nr:MULTISPECIES: hypothetical protein [unclassified Mesorhizobium]RUV19943.1 hypothetical protein EOB80_17135 [Mesorhizobium sp. M7A.F.Ca.MR.245.00.0.0]RUV37426.1 hypothetical protein EOB49_11740 [Mesorhizobium sp. M7A.F.Ca.MR.148.00.0.0]RUV53803.1 hypothetical protein EOB77_00710 [Mesorhizobium sp. M7A.F.Ca.MR.228.00.0.0]
MARFFFDLTANNELYPDPQGTELGSLEAAKYEAAGALLEIAKDRMPNGTFREFSVNVRDDTRNSLFVVKVTLQFLTQELLTVPS